MSCYTDNDGTAYYINAAELLETPDMERGIIAEWVDTDYIPWVKSTSATEVYYPITASDPEQLNARADLLRSGDLTEATVVNRASGLHE